MRAKIISIGTLASNHLWDEVGEVRTGHATTTLIETGNARIIVDPGLPAVALKARLAERTRVTPEQITHVFLTSFQPDVWRGIELFSRAEWFISELERETIGVALVEQVKKAHEAEDTELRDALAHNVAVLQRCKAAPDSLAKGVDIFPLHGVTPGLTGLIISDPDLTTVVCGDSIATAEHLEKGMVLKQCYDMEKARVSFQEVLEIADIIIPGRDNIVINPLRRSIY